VTHEPRVAAYADREVVVRDDVCPRSLQIWRRDPIWTSPQYSRRERVTRSTRRDGSRGLFGRGDAPLDAGNDQWTGRAERTRRVDGNQSHSQRPTQRGGELSVTTPSLGSPIWWIVSSNQFENQLIVQIDVAATGAHPLIPPGILRCRAGAVLRVAGTGRIAAHDAGE